MAYSKIKAESTEPKLIVLQFITSKITSRKLNGDNYLRCLKIVEINFTGHVNKSHLYKDPSNSKWMNWSKRMLVFGQLLNIMDPKIQDLVMYTLTMKEMQNYFEELYSEKNNLNSDFNVIQEMFRSKRTTKPCPNIMQTSTRFMWN